MFRIILILLFFFSLSAKQDFAKNNISVGFASRFTFYSINYEHFFIKKYSLSVGIGSTSFLLKDYPSSEMENQRFSRFAVSLKYFGGNYLWRYIGAGVASSNYEKPIPFISFGFKTKQNTGFYFKGGLNIPLIKLGEKPAEFNFKVFNFLSINLGYSF